MKVVQFLEYGPPEVLRVAERLIPDIGPSDVKVRIAAIGVNPADVKWRAGMFKDFMPLDLPHVLGYDIAGYVQEIGFGVNNVSLGQRVCAMLDTMKKGAYAEYAVLPASAVVPIPDKLDMTVAAALPTAALTGVQVIEEHIKPSIGQTIMVTGALGAVGRFMVDAARRQGCQVVAAVRESQKAEALGCGASIAIALGSEAWNGALFDHVADTVGGPEVASLCRHASPAARIVTVATRPISAEGLPTQPVFIGVHGDPERLRRLVQAVDDGDIFVPVAKRLPLHHAAEAHRLVEAGGNKGKIILEP
jgi:NADPH:quinone reductase-like Zn-dependent oxidoreductase